MPIYPEQLTVQDVTVRALKPSVLPDLHSSSQKKARYTVRIANNASGSRTVWITKHAAYDRDGKRYGGGEDELIHSKPPYSVDLKAGDVTDEPGFVWTFRDYDGPDPRVELFHLVTFQVISPDGWKSEPATVWSPLLHAVV